MLTCQHKEKIDQARVRFGRPFAHEEGSDWKPRNVPFLTQYFRNLKKGPRGNQPTR